MEFRTYKPIWLGILAAALLTTPHMAFAQQTSGTVTISDLSESPITANMSGGTNQINQDLTADPTTPETLSNSFPIDGLVPGGTGWAVLRDDTGVSDLLQVTVTPRVRGQGINYFDASWTFTSDGDPGGLDIGTMLGLNTTQVDAILAAGLIEDGTPQNMSSHLIDANGNALNVGGLVVTAQSDLDAPEPSGMLALCMGVAASGAFFRRAKRSRNKTS